MVTLPPHLSARELHRARGIAESFGSDPERYDQTRPRYPQALVDRIVAAAPGPDLLDVGTGTGVAARPFRAAGCRVLGVDPDARMAEWARRDGIQVEVARFEEWDPAGRMFDAVVAGQAWHWVDPVAGAARAAGILRPGGRLAVFWNVFELPSDLHQAFAAVYRRVVPDSPLLAAVSSGVSRYSAFLSMAADGWREVGAFAQPERWQFDWERPYTRREWLAQVPTFGGHHQLAPGRLEELTTGLGAAIDALGGAFTMRFATVALTSVRNAAP